MVRITYKNMSGKTLYWACSENLLEKYLEACETKGFEVLDWDYM